MRENLNISSPLDTTAFIEHLMYHSRMEHPVYRILVSTCHWNYLNNSVNTSVRENWIERILPGLKEFILCYYSNFPHRLQFPRFRGIRRQFLRTFFLY